MIFGKVSWALPGGAGRGGCLGIWTYTHWKAQCLGEIIVIQSIYMFVYGPGLVQGATQAVLVRLKLKLINFLL